MKQKILTFVVHGKKILALYSESHPKHGEGGWFVVTGSVEEGESYKEAVAREIREETGLNFKKIFPLNWGSIYTWRDESCEEFNFLTFVKKRKVVLNEEHTTYEWLDLDSFVNKIKWNDDKELLKKVLKKAIKGELYFKEKTVKDYRI